MKFSTVVLLPPLPCCVVMPVFGGFIWQESSLTALATWLRADACPAPDWGTSGLVTGRGEGHWTYYWLGV